MTLAMRVIRGLRNLREYQGLSQAQLAEQIGVEPQTVSRYERGLLDPSLERVEAMLGALNAQPHRFFSDLYTDPNTWRSADAHLLVTLADTAPTRDLRAVIELASIHLDTVRRARSEVH